MESSREKSKEQLRLKRQEQKKKSADRQDARAKSLADVTLSKNSKLANKLHSALKTLCESVSKRTNLYVGKTATHDLHKHSRVLILYAALRVARMSTVSTSFHSLTHSLTHSLVASTLLS